MPSPHASSFTARGYFSLGTFATSYGDIKMPEKTSPTEKAFTGLIWLLMTTLAVFFIVAIVSAVKLIFRGVC